MGTEVREKITKVIGVGACYLDTILTVPYYPSEDEKLRATSLVHRRGGNVPNTLEVLSQLVRVYDVPISLALIATLPAEDSAASQRIRDSLGGNRNGDRSGAGGVDLSQCIYRSGHTEAASSYIIKSTGSGSRTIVNYNNLPEMTLAEFQAAADALLSSSPSSTSSSSSDDGKGSGCLFHFEGRIPDVTVECVRYLRRAYPEVQISVEVEKPRRPGLRELAAEADYVFYSRGWAEAEGYSGRALDLFWGEVDRVPRAKMLVLTRGEKGADFYTVNRGGAKREERSSHWPAWLPQGGVIVDTVGAGDTFTAGTLFRISCDGRADLHFSTRLAGHKVTQEGFDGLAEKMKRAQF